MERCFYQVFRPEAPFNNDWGDCPKCSHDEKNKECRGFHEITLTVFEVEE